VDWHQSKAIMLHVGFGDRWGLKQGDHLSSYIFILALIVFFVLEIWVFLYYILDILVNVPDYQREEFGKYRGDETVKWIWKIGNTLVLQLTRSLICVWRNNCQQRICDFDWAGISFNGADVGVNGVVILCFSFICLIKHINLLQFLFYTK
jgi:hypothetical protein